MKVVQQLVDKSNFYYYQTEFIPNRNAKLKITPSVSMLLVLGVRSATLKNMQKLYT